MDRLVIALVVFAAVAAFAAVVRSKRHLDAPSGADGFRAPAQLSRADFSSPAAPWLVVVFSSATCDACASMVSKAQVLASGNVAVQAVEFPTDRALHQRYRIDAVPTTVIAAADGVVVRSFLGPVSATDLWAAVAEARAPGSSPGPCQGHRDGEPSGSDQQR